MTVHEFRRAALGLRDVVEGAHMGHPDFRINNRIFASLNAEQTIGTVKLSADEQQHFVSRDATVFEPAAGAWGLQGWTKVHLAAADAEAVGEALTLAWQAMSTQAPPKTRSSRAAKGSASTRSSSVATQASETTKGAAKRSVKTTTTSATKAAATPAAKSRASSTTSVKTPRTARAAAPSPAAGASAKRASAAKAASTIIDEYIAQYPPRVRTMLNTVRKIVKTEAPLAVDKFSYRMPAFELNGMLLYYAPFKNHLGIFPPVKGDAALAKALTPYRGEKGNLRFSFDQPIPYPLIRRVVQARLKEHQARLASRKTKSSAAGSVARTSAARARR